MSKVTIYLSVLFMVILTAMPSFGDTPILFRISVENSDTHVQTQYVRRFAHALEAEMPGVFNVQFYAHGQLYGDREVVPAMARGTLEMAVPGTWQLDRYIPEISVFLLPYFYGTNGSMNDRYLASSQGLLLLRSLEHNLGVRIPGLWMDLGPAHVFTTNRRITSRGDFSGLTIRVAGGEANKIRIDTLGAKGIIVAWGDLPAWLQNGSVDGVLTSFETIRSAALWESGLRYAYTDHQYFPQYVPMVAERVFSRLTNEQQDQFQQIWNRIAVEEREAARVAQEVARQELERRGIEIIEPSIQEQARTRAFLMNFVNAMVENLAIDRRFLPDLLE